MNWWQIVNSRGQDPTTSHKKITNPKNPSQVTFRQYPKRSKKTVPGRSVDFAIIGEHQRSGGILIPVSTIFPAVPPHSQQGNSRFPDRHAIRIGDSDGVTIAESKIFCGPSRWSTRSHFRRTHLSSMVMDDLCGFDFFCFATCRFACTKKT